MMIAPVCEQNAIGRNVYLPERMKLYRFRSTADFDTEVLEAGDHFVPADLNEVLIFIRPGHIVPLAAPGAENTDEVSLSAVSAAATQPLTLSFVETGTAEYRWYDDDGYTRNYEMQKHIRIIREDAAGTVTVENAKA